MNIHKKISHSIPYLFSVLLIVQILFLIYCNLSDNINYVDSDMGMGLYHFSEMVKNKTINLMNYHNTTTLEVDTSFLLAAPIYLITDNLSLSVGISNLFIIAMYGFVVCGIMTELETKYVCKIITLILFFTPYAIGMLDYFNMMFLGLSCYSIKAMVALLAIYLVIRKNRKSVPYFLALILYLILLFITTLSSGLYSLLCGVVPVVLFFMIRMWQNSSVQWLKNKYNLLWLFSSLFSSGLGLYFFNRFYTEGSRSDTLLNQSELFIDNTLSYIKGFFLLFGALPDTEVKVLSLSGMNYLVKVLLVLTLTAVFIKELKSIHRNQKDTQLLAFVFLWNVLIVFVSKTRIDEGSLINYRYLIVGTLPLIILLGKTLNDRSLTWTEFQKTTAAAALLLFLAILQYGCNKNVLNYFETKNTSLKELCQYIDTLNVRSVIWINETESLNICKGTDDDHIWGCWISDDRKLYNGVNCYENSDQNSFYDEDAPSALIGYLDTELTDFVPEEIASHYTYAGSVDYYDIYVSDGVYFN